MSELAAWTGVAGATMALRDKMAEADGLIQNEMKRRQENPDWANDPGSFEKAISKSRFGLMKADAVVGAAQEAKSNNTLSQPEKPMGIGGGSQAAPWMNAYKNSMFGK